MEVINLSDDEDVSHKNIAENNTPNNSLIKKICETIDLTEALPQHKNITINEDSNLKRICANEKRTLLYCKKECFPPLPSPLVRILIIYLSKLYPKRQNTKFRNHLLKTYGFKSDNNDVWTVIDKWCCLLDIKKANQGKYFLCSKKSGKIILPVEHYKDAVLNEHVNPSKNGEHRNFEDTYRALDQKYSLGLDNFGMSKVFVYFYVKACNGCRMNLPSYDTILSKNYTQKLELKLFKVKPTASENNVDANDEIIEIVADEFEDLMEAPNEAFTKVVNKEENVNVKNKTNSTDKTMSSSNSNNIKKYLDISSNGNKSYASSSAKSYLSSSAGSNLDFLELGEKNKTGNAPKASESNVKKNRSKSRKKKRKLSANKGDFEPYIIRSSEADNNIFFSAKKKIRRSKELFITHLNDNNEEGKNFDEINSEPNIKEPSKMGTKVKENNLHYSENDDIDNAITSKVPSSVETEEESGLVSVEKRITLMVKSPSSNENRAITLVAESAATANRILKDINTLQVENEISIDQHIIEDSDFSKIFEKIIANKAFNFIATENIDAGSSLSKVKLEDYFSPGVNIQNLEQDCENPETSLKDVKNIFDYLGATSDMITKSDFGNCSNAIRSQYIRTTSDPKLMSHVNQKFNTDCQKNDFNKNDGSEVKNYWEEDYFVNSLPTFAWPIKETSTVWHNLCNLANETNSYIKLNGIINEIGLDIPAALNGDAVSSDAVNTKIFCALEVIKTLKESTKLSDISIDSVQYKELVNAYCKSSHHESFLYDMNILASIDKFLLCDKYIHSLTQAVANRLNSHKKCPEEIDFDEEFDLYESLPIEELQYFPNEIEGNCAIEMDNENITFTVEDIGNR